jgi:hypothetical protein
MQAATVELLTRKAKFPSEQALAVAEAIDMAIADQQLVTVPILDARLAAAKAEMDVRFAAAKADIDSRFAAAKAEMDSRFAAVDAKLDAGFAATKADMGAGFAATKADSDARFAGIKADSDARFAGIKADSDARFAQTDARIAELGSRLDRFRLQIIIAILIGHVALGPVGMAIIEAIRHAF